MRAERPLDEVLDDEARRAAGTPPAVGLERVVDVVLVADVDELAPQRQLLQSQRDHRLRQGPDQVPGLQAACCAWLLTPVARSSPRSAIRHPPPSPISLPGYRLAGALVRLVVETLMQEHFRNSEVVGLAFDVLAHHDLVGTCSIGAVVLAGDPNCGRLRRRPADATCRAGHWVPARVPWGTEEDSIDAGSRRIPAIGLFAFEEESMSTVLSGNPAVATPVGARAAGPRDPTSCRSSSSPGAREVKDVGRREEHAGDGTAMIRGRRCRRRARWPRGRSLLPTSRPRNAAFPRATADWRQAGRRDR